MRYQRIENEKEAVSYRVTQRGVHVADFSYHFEEGNIAAREEDRRFWLDGVTLFGEFACYEYLDEILQFAGYKCCCAGIHAMYLKISGKNLFYLELYKKFGFYVIAEEEYQIHKGISAYGYVMKYPLPRSREEAFDHYIRRK